MARGPSKSLLSFFLFCVLVTAVARFEAERRFVWQYPFLDKLVANEFFLTDLGFLMFGSRRIAADLGYVQYLQYYSTRESKIDSAAPILSVARSPFSFRRFDAPFLGDAHSGPFPRLYEMSLRILRLDPFFTSAIAEGGAVLAFNHQRFSQALNLFKDALGWNPLSHQCRLYMAVILYKSHNKEEPLLEILKQAIQYPDCPVLLERVLANLFIKYGRVPEAVAILEHIRTTAPLEKDRMDASQRMKALRTL